MTVSGRGALVGGLAAVWLGLAIAAGLSFFVVVASVAALVLGAVLVVAWPETDEPAREMLRWAAAKLETDEAYPPRPVPEPDPETADTIVADALTGLAGELGVQRLVVWRVDRAADAVAPEHVVGAEPRTQRAAGNPVAWAVDERHAMALSPAPSWTRGDAVVAPIDRDRAVTVEAAPGDAPAPERVAARARLLAALLRLADRDTDARGERDRLHRVTGFLQSLSGAQDPERVPESLAEAALDLVGARGALVAAWDGEAGIVLTRTGDPDGPGPGHEFGAGDGDLTHAARTSATVVRTPGDAGTRPALASPGEHWQRIAPYRVAVPLLDPEGRTGGLVAAWSDREPSPEGIGLLEGLGPLLSLHLRHATDLVRYRRRATADALTGLPNRAAFDERLAEEQTRFHRYRRPTALLVIDLDHFKAINDIHGHEAGDAVLREVAATVRTAVRDVDVAARYGGEELVVLMPETMLRAARDVAERVREAIDRLEVRHQGATIPVTASIGVSACPELADEPLRLFDSADEALYAAKEAGRNRVTVGGRD